MRFRPGPLDIGRRYYRDTRRSLRVGAARVRRFAHARDRIVVSDILSEEGRTPAVSFGKPIAYQPCEVGVPADVDAGFVQALH